MLIEDCKQLELLCHQNFIIWLNSIIYSFHMPLFFFLSGLFFIKSIEKKGKLLLFIDKFKTIAYPYLVWSLLQGTIEVLLSRFTNSKTSFTESVDAIFTSACAILVFICSFDDICTINHNILKTIF
ncbi:acyltransferase family protein [Klebsiella pneumoniae]